MKLAAIYNVWDGVELLRGSMECLKNDVDLFIIVWQDTSNFGEHYNPMPEMVDFLKYFNFVLVKFDPAGNGGQRNETTKRNVGLQIAKIYNCTHFVHLDTDEYYEDFAAAKDLYIESGAAGSVCSIYTYFKKPTLRNQNPDGYYVSFIHKLEPFTTGGYYKDYPFYVDRTRQVNCDNVVALPVKMHHYSWVRKDIERKARNSSAKFNIAKGSLLSDYHSNVGPGYYIKDWEQILIEVPNIFNIQI